MSYLFHSTGTWTQPQDSTPGPEKCYCSPLRPGPFCLFSTVPFSGEILSCLQNLHGTCTPNTSKKSINCQMHRKMPLSFQKLRRLILLISCSPRSTPRVYTLRSACSRRYNLQTQRARGKGVASRMWFTPSSIWTRRSNPTPKPPCGHEPNRRRSRYLQETQPRGAPNNTRETGMSFTAEKHLSCKTSVVQGKDTYSDCKPDPRDRSQDGIYGSCNRRAASRPRAKYPGWRGAMAIKLQFPTHAKGHNPR